MLDGFATTIKANNPDNIVTNGGLVFSEDINIAGGIVDTDYADYFTTFNQMINANKLNFVSLHGHATYFEMAVGLVTAIEPISASISMPLNKILINEDGFSSGTLKNQAANVIAKLVYSKAKGYRGHNVFSLLAGDMAQPEYNVYTNNVEPRPLFLQYMTAMKLIKGNAVATVYPNGGMGLVSKFMDGPTEILVFINAVPSDVPMDVTGYTYYDAYGNANSSLDTAVKYYVK